MKFEDEPPYDEIIEELEKSIALEQVHHSEQHKFEWTVNYADKFKSTYMKENQAISKDQNEAFIANSGFDISVSIDKNDFAASDEDDI